MTVKEILSQMTLEEKAAILTGAESMLTTGVPRLGIPGKKLADGPHGVRDYTPGTNCTTLPSMCAIGATWSKEAAELAGKTMGIDCIHDDKQMLLGPGLNIKRNALGGRNFEYVSEDPILTGEIAGHVVKGLEDLGIGTSMKHFALNSHETYRTETSVEIDERTMREIYLRGFEKAIQIGNPTSLMCAYNKIHSLWCSENYNLLTEILRHDWGYEGMVVSDWGAVHHGAKAVKAGLDLRMPGNPDTIRDVKEAIANGTMTMEELDTAAERVLHFLLKPVPKEESYDRDAQHEAARNVAREAICLLRNDRDLLPITPKKYKKICVTGEYAVMPYINGQGSAEVFTEPEYVDTPLECLRRMLPDVQIDYFDYLPRKKPDKMLWHYFREKMPNIESYDLVLVFTGVAPSDDSEQFDRGSNQLAGYIEDVMRNVTFHNPNCALILCSGCSTFKSPKADLFPAIVQMWPTGEGAGQAIADVLTGAVNPSGKLSETFPTKMRTDMDLYGEGLFVEYTEKWRVGYRYYDLHTDEIWFPFGHGLHYTTFDYANSAVVKNDKGWELSFDLTNAGEMDGAEAVQLYVGDPVATVSKPIKELKQFEKVFLKAGETKRVTFQITDEDLSYYNVSMHKWVVENGVYDLYICASSQDIRLKESIEYNDPNSYSMQKLEAMIG